VNNCTNFTAHPSYEPRQSRYNRDWQGVDKPHLPSPYSGILECPCNSRYGGDPMVYGPNCTTKIIKHEYATIPSGTCGSGKDINNAIDCFSVASTLGIEASSLTNKSVADATFPGGCTVTANKDGTATVTYNSKLAAPCSRASLHVGEASTNANVTVHISLQANSSKPWMKKQAKGEWCSDNHVNVLAKYPAASMSEADLEAALDKCNNFCLGSDKCNFCSADDLRPAGGSVVQFVALPACGNINHWDGSILGDVSAKATDPKPTMFRHKKGQYCLDNHQGVLAKFVAASISSPDVAKALSQCEDYCINVDACNYCSVDKLTTTVQFVAIPACGSIKTWDGTMVGDVSEKTTASSGTATITISGPADVWFGVGLNAQKMSDSPYVIYANSSGAFEQQIGTCGSEAEHCPGNPLAPSITLESNSVVSGVRTVVLTRPFKGLTDKHYSFRPDNVNTLNIISASGSSQTFAYHRLHDPAVISFTSPGVPVCVCDEGHSGQLCTDDGHCGSFTKRCLSHDQGGDLLSQRNPTCNSIQYAGGLSCCGHRRIMLDADQEVRPELLQYHMKFRFWFQEYVPANASSSPKGTTRPTTASHYNLPRIYFQTEANAGEYDIPPAFATEQYPLIPGYPNYPLHKPTPGTTCTGTCPGDDCECVHTITFNHTVSNMRLIYAGGHCHAPSCIGIWLYRNDPGHEMELLCHQRTMYGEGNVVDNKYDEAGYVALPPCLWGEDKGLEPSVLLPPNTELVSIKKNRNTNMGHYGEMASWQMRGVSF